MIPNVVIVESIRWLLGLLPIDVTIAKSRLCLRKPITRLTLILWLLCIRSPKLGLLVSEDCLVRCRSTTNYDLFQSLADALVPRDLEEEWNQPEKSDPKDDPPPLQHVGKSRASEVEPDQDASDDPRYDKLEDGDVPVPAHDLLHGPLELRIGDDRLVLQSLEDRVRHRCSAKEKYGIEEVRGYVGVVP